MVGDKVLLTTAWQKYELTLMQEIPSLNLNYSPYSATLAGECQQLPKTAQIMVAIVFWIP